MLWNRFRSNSLSIKRHFSLNLSALLNNNIAQFIINNSTSQKFHTMPSNTYNSHLSYSTSNPMPFTLFYPHLPHFTGFILAIINNLNQPMQKPMIPKPPAHLPPKNSPLVPPNNQPRMNRSKSQQRLSKGKGQSAQKRVRLRDYLFVASTSAMRNNQKKKTLKSSLSQQSLLKQSINILKKQKYQLPNSEMYLIVKQQINKDLKSLIQSLKARMDILQAQDTFNPSNDDLKYLYNIKRIIGQGMQPAIKEMQQLSFKRTGNVLKDFIEKEMLHRNAITQAIKEQDKRPNNLFESFIIFNKN